MRKVNRAWVSAKHFLSYGVLFFSVCMIVFFLIEGISSFVLVAKEIIDGTSRVAERVHTKYDKRLGWINVPNVHILDMYGRGKYLQTNSQSFRNSKDFPTRVPQGKLRIICSGDSFTLGYGVSNLNSWCHLLESNNRRLEAVNMGQGGYGIDQAYLWYEREGVKLDHQIHLFAFITGDFFRMRANNFLGYGKPVIRLQDNGDIVVDNIPVPRPDSLLLRLIRGVRSLENLRTLKLFLAVRRRIFPFKDMPSGEENMRTLRIALKIFEKLKEMSEKKNSSLVLLHLPTQGDYKEEISDFWRDNLGRELKKRGMNYIDLIPLLRELPPARISEMFIAGGVLQYAGAAGHYTEEGNKYISDKIYEKLVGLGLMN